MQEGSGFQKLLSDTSKPPGPRALKGLPIRRKAPLPQESPGQSVNSKPAESTLVDDEAHARSDGEATAASAPRTAEHENGDPGSRQDAERDDCHTKGIAALSKSSAIAAASLCCQAALEIKESKREISAKDPPQCMEKTYATTITAMGRLVHVNLFIKLILSTFLHAGGNQVHEKDQEKQDVPARSLRAFWAERDIKSDGIQPRRPRTPRREGTLSASQPVPSQGV